MAFHFLEKITAATFANFPPVLPHCLRTETIIEPFNFDSPPALLPNIYSTSDTVAFALINFRRSNNTLNPGLSKFQPFFSTIS